MGNNQGAGARAFIVAASPGWLALDCLGMVGGGLTACCGRAASWRAAAPHNGARPSAAEDLSTTDVTSLCDAGTNTSAVQAVLQAAGVWLAPRGSSISGLAAAAPHGATGWALQAGAAAHSVAPLLAQLPPHGHVLHVVQDIRQLASAEHWARTNLGLKAWATQSGLGIARRYSVARIEDLCSPDAVAAQTAVRTMLQHAGLVAPASIAALLASLAQHCPLLSSTAATPELANNSSSGAVLYSARTAFDYKPALPIGARALSPALQAFPGPPA